MALSSGLRDVGLPWLTRDDTCSREVRVQLANSALLSAKLVKDAILKVYPGAPHGLMSTHKEQLNEDLLAFLRS